MFTKFNTTLRISDWRRLYSEALTKFDGGRLNILSDGRLSENSLSHEELIQIFDHLLRLGVVSIVCALTVNDRLFHLKEKLFNEIAHTHEIEDQLKSFEDINAAKNWLVDSTDS